MIDYREGEMAACLLNLKNREDGPGNVEVFMVSHWRVVP